MKFSMKLSSKLIPAFLLAVFTLSGIWGISVQKRQMPQSFTADKSSYSQKRIYKEKTGTSEPEKEYGFKYSNTESITDSLAATEK